MTNSSERAKALLEQARSQRPALDAQRKQRVKQAVVVSVAAAASGAAATAEAGVIVKSGWLATVGGKAIVGVGAALIGSSLTYGVMVVKSERRAAVTGTRVASQPVARAEVVEEVKTVPLEGVAEVPSDPPDVVEVPPTAPALNVARDVVAEVPSPKPAPSAPREVVADVKPTNVSPTPSAPRDVVAEAKPNVSPAPSSPREVVAEVPPAKPAPSAPREVVAEAKPNVSPTPSAPRDVANEPSTPPIPMTASRSRATTNELRAASLKGELSLLQKAMALHEAGDETASLEVLSAYEARHPTGSLVAEALSLRVLVLCALSRADEAVAVRAQLERVSPEALKNPRLAKSCANQ